MEKDRERARELLETMTSARYEMEPHPLRLAQAYLLIDIAESLEAIAKKTPELWDHDRTDYVSPRE